MALRTMTATVATVVLFGSGAAVAGLAYASTTTAEPAATTQTEPTTSESTSTIATTTSTSTATTVNTETPTTVTTETAPTSISTDSSLPRRETPARVLPHAPRVSHAVGKVRPARPQHKRHRHPISKPLTVTPRLGLDSYVFPVVGVSGYGDSYGAFRGDVHGKWHHGDDIFAPLGAPVVAVAAGTINRVGWHRLGGWRLWVRDAATNQFYYAHLSGYAPGVFHSRHVKAGDVLGFIGTTGDAFGGAPHLHFEIHPHQLLRLRYDGAVDPTTYLNSWARMRSVHAPVPVHPRFPKHPALRKEAREVFRRLLVARHLIPQPTVPIEQSEGDPSAHRDVPSLPRLPSLRREPALATASGRSAVPTGPLLAGLLVVAVFVATPLLATTVLTRVLRKRVRA